MKYTMKKMGCVLLMICLLLSCTPMVAGAFPIRVGRFTPLQTITVYFPNPRDADQQLRTVRSAPVDMEMRPFGEEEYLTDLSSAAAVLREGMKNRQNVITVLYKAPASQDFSTEVAEPIWKAAQAHTGEPTEGDYLKWQWDSFSAGGGGYSDGVNNYYTIEFYLSYYTTSQQESQVDAAVAELMTALELDTKNDYDAFRAVYDWMCANITYDYANLENDGYDLKYTAYAALQDRTSVCQGYALLMYRLMLEQGIDCRVITGDAGGPHAWNIVELDGLYYNLDSTWDATYRQNGLEYAYCLRSDGNFTDHIREEEYTTEAFYDQYPMGGSDYVPPAVEQVAGGTDGSINWVLTSDGKLTISGTGMLGYYYAGGVPWASYSGSIYSLEIKDGITRIGDYAFYELDELISASIPGSVEYIGLNAFYGCNKLANVKIHDGVTTLASGTFQNCSSLTSITLPDSITDIQSSVFSGCTNLTSVIIPDGVTRIEDSLFDCCWSLTDISIPDSVTSIGEFAFNKCSSLAQIHIPDSVTSIGRHAFYGCTGLTAVDIPAGVTAIEYGTFQNCSRLTSVEIPDNIVTIGNYAFSNCENLSVVTIGSNVTSIGDNAFGWCFSLWKVINNSVLELVIGEYNNGAVANYALVVIDRNGNRTYRDNTWGETDDGFLYTKESSGYILRAYTGEESTITLPDTIQGESYRIFQFLGAQYVIIPDTRTSIEEKAFYDCKTLIEITIPDSVTIIGAYAFAECDNLTGVDIAGGVVTIDMCAFHNCENLTWITMPDSLTTIGGAAFASCTGLTSVEIPNGVMFIGGGAFSNCTSLASIKIPASVTGIGGSAFSGCSSLTGIWVDSGNANYSSDERGVLFNKEQTELLAAPGALSGAYTLPDGVTIIVDNAFYGCSGLTGVSMPDGVTSIGRSAFAYCTGLTGVSMPESVTYIGNSAFFSCAGLIDITLPTGLTAINDSVFNGCSSLAVIEIPDGVTSIGYSAFSSCTSLTSVSIPGSVTSIGPYAFSMCHNLTSINIPDGVTVLEKSTFYECVRLTSVHIPDSVTCIEDTVFNSCYKLTDVTIGKGVVSLGRVVFGYSYRLKAIIFTGDTPEFSSTTFSDITATVYYPVDNDTWTEEIRQNYGGNITWKSMCSGTHVFEATVTAPTCLEQGFTTHACTICEYEYADTYVDATGHSYDSVVTAPTCTEQGYTTHTCTSCGDVVVDSYTELAPHEFGEWKLWYPPTCTSKGYERRYCQHCNFEETKMLEATGHTMGEWVLIRNANCITRGQEEQTCETCGYRETRETDYGDHVCMGWETAPTCTEQGYTTHSCYLCGYSYQDNFVDALGHDYEVVVKAPTCTEQGYTTCTCYRCGDSYTEDYLEPIGHQYETVVTEPTCTEQGYTSDTCIHCGDCSVYAYTDPLGHSYSSVTTIPPTCEADGLTIWECLLCGDSYTEVTPATGHLSLHMENQKDASCSENGYTGDWVCDACGKIVEYGYIIGATGEHNYIAQVIMEPTCVMYGEVRYTCAVCGDSYTETIPATGHLSTHLENQKDATCGEPGYSGDWVCDVCGQIVEYGYTIGATGEHNYSVSVISNPTCVLDGLQMYTCNGCGNSYTETIPATGHLSTHLENQKDATCGKQGYSGDWVCDTCGEIVEYGYIIGATGEHNYSVSTFYDPTCVMDGQRIYTCNGCGNSYTETIPATGHLSTHLENQKDATCGEPGYSGDWVCDACGEIVEYGEFTEPTGEHNYQPYVLVEPGCETEGVVRYICAQCADAYEEVIPPVGHEEVIDSAVAPTCTETGLTEGKHCSVCGEILVKQEVVSATGHSYGEWYTVTEPGEYTEGLEQRECSACGYYETRAIPALGHTHSYETVVTDPTCTDQGYTTYICRCGDSYIADETAALGHDMSDWVQVKVPTCTEKGQEQRICSRCDYSESREVAELGHNYVSSVTAPTCTDGGYTTYTCTNCGASYTADHVSALGHNYEAITSAPTCTEQGYTTHTCANCGDSYTDSYTEALGHSWNEGVVTIEPTVEAEGEKTYTCTVCGATYTESIPKKEPVIYDTPEDGTVEIPENDCFEGGTTITVEKVEEGEIFQQATQAMEDMAEAYVVFEFTAIKDGAAVQPNGKLTVTFDIPAEYSTNVALYYLDDNGKLTKLDGVVNEAERTITVELEHFSTYILADEDTAPSVLLGDVNGDGRVNARDARLLLRYLAGLTEEGEVDVSAADFNGDGRVNARDARAILQYLAGIN